MVVAWLAATAAAPVDLPVADSDSTRPVTVLLFAGPPDSGGMAPLGRAIDKRGGRHVAIDVLIGGRAHDLQDATPGGVGWHLRQAAQKGHVHSMHAAIPCETFSVAVDDEDVCRSAEQPMGISGLPPHRAERVFKSNALVYFTLDLARDIIAAGGHVTIENPAPRNDVSLPQAYWAEKAHHASLFRTRPVLDYAAETLSVEIVTPLCAFGSPMQKYIMLLASPVWRVP